LGTKITVPNLLEEAGSMGAAVIGGVGVGLFSDFTAIARFIEVKSEHLPMENSEKIYEPIKNNFDMCYEALKTTFADMSKN